MAKHCWIGPNGSSLIMPALMSSIHSPDTIATGVTTFHHSYWKSGWRDYAWSTTRLCTTRMYLTNQLHVWSTFRIFIWCTVRCDCVGIPHKVAWFVRTQNGSLPPCRSNVQYNTVSEIPNSFRLYTPYHCSVLCNILVKYLSTFSAISYPWESTVPSTYWLASTCW